MRGVVLGVSGIAHPGIQQENAVAVGNVVGGASRYLVPAVSEFLPESELHRKIAPQLDRVVDVPGPEQAFLHPELDAVRNHLKIRQRPRQERAQARKGSDPDCRDATSSLSWSR